MLAGLVDVLRVGVEAMDQIGVRSPRVAGRQRSGQSPIAASEMDDQSSANARRVEDLSGKFLFVGGCRRDRRD